MRSGSVTLEDVVAMVRAVAARSGPDDSPADLALTILLRARAARAHRLASGRPHAVYGDGSLCAAAVAFARESGGGRPTTPRKLLRAGAAVCRLLAGDAPAGQRRPSRTTGAAAGVSNRRTRAS
jgi:hypothetical protein